MNQRKRNKMKSDWLPWGIGVSMFSQVGNYLADCTTLHCLAMLEAVGDLD